MMLMGLSTDEIRDISKKEINIDFPESDKIKSKLKRCHSFDQI